MGDMNGSMDIVNCDDVVMEKKDKLSRKEQKKIDEENAAKERKEKAIKSMRYLLKVSERFTEFYKQKIESETKIGKNANLKEKNKLQPTIDDMRDVAATKDEDVEDVQTNIAENLKYFQGSLRPYQIEGVNWLKVLCHHSINGILADEMGLGKTIQVIALICHLYEINFDGPFLIIAPLSTLPNWKSEFKKFAPRLPVIVVHGTYTERGEQFKKVNRKYHLDGKEVKPVVITAYNMAMLEKNSFKYFSWKYIIVDEAQRLKNPDSQLSVILRTLTTANKLLLTGTPLQNNMTELWSLLNFLMPQIFKDINTFASLLMLEDVQDQDKLIEEEQRNNIISTLHRVLKPFMLRRLKKDVLGDYIPKKELYVYCPMSELQRSLYSFVLTKNINQLLGLKEEKEDIINQPRQKRRCLRLTNYCYPNEEDDIPCQEDVFKSVEVKTDDDEKRTSNFITRLTMQNPQTMYRKVVNHPYLIHFPLDPNSKEKTLLVDEDLVTSSGKMLMLDAMLPRLKAGKHKVLIFSTMQMTLDFIEEMMIMRGHRYCRLDGSNDLSSRANSIENFNNDPDIFAFLITTRAGGLGLNLTAADTVIFFDRDWNPQADVQAQDRCHRIGQTKPVMIYTFVTKNTIDEKIIEVGHHKRLLEKLIITNNQFKKIKGEDKKLLHNELKNLQEILQKESNDFQSRAISNKELDKILDRSELYKQMAENRAPLKELN